MSLAISSIKAIALGSLFLAISNKYLESALSPYMILAFLVNALPDDSASIAPGFKYLPSCPLSLTIMFPISPAKPICPEIIFPLTIKAPPIPVECVM